MKTPEKMTRDELIEYSLGLKRMIHGLQKQLTAALDEMVRLSKELKENSPPVV